jgi:hypothetical protein
MGWARWSEMHSETTTSVGAPGNLGMRRAAANAHDTNLLCLLYTRKAQRADATRKPGSDVGGKVRWREGTARSCLALSLSLSLSYKRDSAAGETRDAQRTGVSGGFGCSVFEERLRHGALSSGRRVRSWFGLVWSQTQGLVVLGVSVA